MSIYNDLFVRGELGETNSYPKSASGAPWTSPDIISYGINQCKDPQAEFLGSHFSTTFNKDILFGAKNYIYIRAKNFANNTQNGKLYLYWTPYSLILSPSLWSQNAIPTTKEKAFVDFHAEASSEYVTTNDDDGLFLWKPTGNPNDHYCLISRVDTTEHPAPIPDLKDVDNFANFLRSEKSMGYAQRNVSLITSGVPTFQTEIDAGNPFAEALSEGYLLINCENIPAGCDVALSCTGTSSSLYLDIPRQAVTPNAQNTFTVAVHFNSIPAHFKNTATMYLWSNGITLSNAKFSLDFIYLPPAASMAFKYASPVHDLGIQRLHTKADNAGLFGDDLKEVLTPRAGLRIGRCQSVSE